MPDASLTVNGQRFLGWTEVSVTRSLQQLAHSFDFSYAEQFSGEERPVPILEGASCQVYLGDTVVMDGYVDDAEIAYDATSHRLHVCGRSKTADLIDCTAIYATGKGQWRNQPLAQIAADLVQPFGLTVRVSADLGAPLRKFSLQHSETVYEALDRACRSRGVVMQTSPQSELVLTRATTTRRTETVLEYGKNVIAGNRSGSWRDRFRDYTCKSQTSGQPNFFGAVAAQPKRTAHDPDITRYRPLIVLSEHQETGAELQKRVDYERNYRAGQSQKLQYTVLGWENAEGLWEPNVLVRVRDNVLRVHKELLILSVQQTKGAGGTVTNLELADPKAISVEPWTAKPDRASAWMGV